MGSGLVMKFKISEAARSSRQDGKALNMNKDNLMHNKELKRFE